MPTLRDVRMRPSPYIVPQMPRSKKPAEVPIVIVPDGTLTLTDDIVAFSSADHHACEAFMLANGMDAVPTGGYGNATHLGAIHYGRIPLRCECWTAFVWPRD